jgi:hypothetical protein
VMRRDRSQQVTTLVEQRDAVTSAAAGVQDHVPGTSASRTWPMAVSVISSTRRSPAPRTAPCGAVGLVLPDRRSPGSRGAAARARWGNQPPVRSSGPAMRLTASARRLAGRTRMAADVSVDLLAHGWPPRPPRCSAGPRT